MFQEFGHRYRKEKKRIISKLINNNFYEKVESITEKYDKNIILKKF